MCRTQFWAVWALHLVTSCSTITESTSLGTTGWHKATPVYNALHIDFRKTFIVRIICDPPYETQSWPICFYSYENVMKSAWVHNFNLLIQCLIITHWKRSKSGPKTALPFHAWIYFFYFLFLISTHISELGPVISPNFLLMLEGSTCGASFTSNSGTRVHIAE